jgi:multisubunit Na+/H+ antiporter MnhG subunit
MDLRDVVATALVVVCLVTVSISTLGVVTMRGLYNRLHYLGPVSIVGSLALGAAVVAQEGLSVRGVKALLVAAVLIVFAPVVTHATARAARIREGETWTTKGGRKVGDWE